MVPIVDKGDCREDGDSSDEDPRDNKAKCPQWLPWVQAHVVAAPPKNQEVDSGNFTYMDKGLKILDQW